MSEELSQPTKHANKINITIFLIMKAIKSLTHTEVASCGNYATKNSTDDFKIHPPIDCTSGLYLLTIEIIFQYLHNRDVN